MISAVVPRPIAFVSTQSVDGCFNLAPFSYFGAMSHDPPIVVFSCCPRGGKPKDTLANAKASGECVVNIISEHFIEAANHCCGEYPPDVDEFELSGLSGRTLHESYHGVYINVCYTIACECKRGVMKNPLVQDGAADDGYEPARLPEARGPGLRAHA